MAIQRRVIEKRPLALHLAAVLLLLLTQPLAAAVITVDGFDSTTMEDGVCTLREAILAANSDLATGGCAAGSGPDTIVVTGDITLTAEDSFQTGTPRLTSRITLRGNGHTIARDPAGPEFRVFWVTGAGDLRLKDATVRYGGGATFGGYGGGLLNEGVLRLTHCNLLDNVAAWGGGIHNLGTLTLAGSLFRWNWTEFGGAGITNFGGTATIAGSTFDANTTNSTGGALDSAADYTHPEAMMTLTSSVVRYNVADEGGGIYNSGSLDVINSTVSGNAAVRGGGIFVGGKTGSLTIVNSTLASNSATESSGSGGGGVYVASVSQEVTFANSLIAANTRRSRPLSFLLPAIWNLSSEAARRGDEATCSARPPGW